MEYYNNWGKCKVNESKNALDYHLLPYHCLDVAATAYTLLQKDELYLKKFRSDIPIENKGLLSLITFYVAIHDIGKFSNSFQSLQPPIMEKLRGYSPGNSYNVRHDSLGYHLWDSLWDYIWQTNILSLDKSVYDKFDWRDLIIPWLRATTGHHGAPPVYSDSGSKIHYDELFYNDDKEMVYSYIKDVSQFLLTDGFLSLDNNGQDDDDIFEELEAYFKKTSWLLSGLVVLCDWIGSSDIYFNYNSSKMSLEQYWKDIALPNSIYALKDSGICPSKTSDDCEIKNLFHYINIPTPMQKTVSEMKLEHGPQLIIIEDTTGSGKTEAAIRLTHRLMNKAGLYGLFFGLPTMATSNAMYERLFSCYSKLFEPKSTPSLVLAHGQSHLSDRFRSTIGPLKTESDSYNLKGSSEPTISAQCSSWIADNRKKALLADVGVGTIDQAMLSVLPSKHQSLRLLGLSRNILVVDEVHAYDPYMNELLSKLLQFHASLGGSSILLSATLPINQKNKMIKSFCSGADYDFVPVSEQHYPLVSHITNKGTNEEQVNHLPQNERKVSCEFFQNEDNVQKRIIDLAQKGLCCCWIRNTVDDAIDSYHSLVDQIGSDKIILFHARYTMGDRLEIEDTVIKSFGKDSGFQQRAGKILVATQVVEQSLDLDFDYMVTDLCPIDLIVQRSGRLHRHKRDVDGNISTIDCRSSPVLGILAPEPTENVSEKWYSDMFPRGCYVYQTHGRLWLTSKILSDMKEMHIPRDSRYLIETVFGNDADKSIPEPLLNVDRQAYGETMAERSIAAWRSLDVSKGYDRTGTQWLDDTIVPTRLGDSITLRLGKLIDGEIVPFNNSTTHPWEMSQVNVNVNRIKYSNYSDEINELIVNTKKNMKDRGKWSLLILMEMQDNGTWTGYGENQNNQRMKIIYDHKTGLTASKN
ncbi:CRISPR-associated helicase Cas3' [Methanosalsum natronophilum]|uniref:CRISPR-associated helicase Cas3' n=1 Tax=Methanosalsum natronophilum TaxID=768733 RepID=UPI002169432A|nr:CRISPR-associated helicase Cas3' [Methanosalsum natronophilum]MCS3923591.1 CRISPR-associated endonuclease/helicase Cas3 [Methanosalsum natronophilum]